MNATPIHDTQVHRVVTRLGGYSEVARYLGITRNRVYRWRLPRESGGTGGLIPTVHVPQLKMLADLIGADVTPADWAP